MQEELVEHIVPNDTTSNEFATRHGSEPYLCRYRRCLRAIQGFNSPDSRQQHENSHVPLFRCNDAACEILGGGLTSRAAMNRHTKKYHDDNGLAAIPTSLRKDSARPQEDRARFLLKEPSSNSRKRSSHVVEEDNVLSEVDGATTPAQSIQESSSSTDYDDQTKDCIIKCICGLTRYEDGDYSNVLKCKSCKTAQHIQCYYVNEHGDLSKPEDYFGHFCIDCKPRSLDVELATVRQMERKKRHSEYLHLLELMKATESIDTQENLQKDTTNRPTVPRSAREREFLRNLICHHGTDWLAIATVIGMRGHTMVCHSWFC